MSTNYSGHNLAVTIQHQAKEPQRRRPIKKKGFISQDHSENNDNMDPKIGIG